jgi:hypothetical protein
MKINGLPQPLAGNETIKIQQVVNGQMAGLYMSEAGNSTIVGNMFLGLTSNTSNTGIDIASTTTFFNENADIVSANQFFYLNQGLVLGSGASGVTAYPNKYANINTADISNSGSGNIIGTLGDELSSYHNETSSRGIGVTYTNNNGKPMYVMVSAYSSAADDQLGVSVNGAQVAVSQSQTAAGGTMAVTFIVPAGATYQITNGTGTPTIQLWYEEF